jgi:aspartyl-tRNA(Asn)/glutamyl-tRNA(Gln) amidotransferase subunit A
MAPPFAPLADLAGLLDRRELSAVELLRGCIARTEALDPRLRAFHSRDDADALAQAAESDARRAAGRTLGPLDGIPAGLKDVIAVRGQPLTAGSRMLEHFVSPYDSTVATRLRAAGAVLWGRLSCDEFAMGSSNENSAFGPVANPWDLSRVPGGSSGGSAAAVAAGLVPVALGSDTGGSIRQPAAFCGIAGLKPTYGLVSRHGLVAYASSLDQIGPFGRTVRDLALVLDAIAGPDELDSTSLRRPPPRHADALAGPAPRRIGVPREYFGAGLDPEVGAAIEAAVRFHRDHGCEVREVSLPHTRHCLDAYYVIATAEASSNLARFDGVRYGHRAAGAADAIELTARSRAEGFGAEVKRRIILGTYVLSSGYHDAFYLRAQQVRTLIRRDFLRAFEEVDALLTPTSPIPAFRRGEKADPLAMYLCDVDTIGVNLAGLPAASIPCGFTASGLPIGLQLIGRPGGEGDLLALAHQYEQEHEWHRREPPLAKDQTPGAKGQ